MSVCDTHVMRNGRFFALFGVKANRAFTLFGLAHTKIP